MVHPLLAANHRLSRFGSHPVSRAAHALRGGAAGGGSDPEAGLTLTRSDAYGILTAANFNVNQNAVFAADFTIPSSPTGLIMELGGSITGTYVGFRSGGEFVIRGGNANTAGVTASAAEEAVLYLTTGQPSGAGTLVWEYNLSLGQIRAWWNDILLGTEAATGGSFRLNQWAAASNGAYLSSGGGGPAGESYTPISATGISSLRYYQNQLSSL